MNFNLDPSVMFCSELQSPKAPLSIDSTELGISTVVKLMFAKNANPPIDLRESLNMIFDKFAQPTNAPFAILFIEFGIVISVNLQLP